MLANDDIFVGCDYMEIEVGLLNRYVNS